MKRLVYLLLFLVVFVLAISVVLKNPNDVDVFYYFDFKWTGPLSVLMFSVLAIGALLGTLLTASWVWRAKRERAAATREMRRMEQEISNLRALPEKE